MYIPNYDESSIQNYTNFKWKIFALIFSFSKIQNFGRVQVQNGPMSQGLNFQYSSIPIEEVKPNLLDPYWHF